MKKLALGLATAVLMSGCATREYVDEQIAAATKRMDGKSAELGTRIDQQGQASSRLEGRLNQQQTALDGVSRTAQEALERASAAGKLAEGKFVYEMTLSGSVSFKSDSSALTREAKETLDKFAADLRAANKNVYLEIQGHTDSRGTPEANLKLGQERADAVRNYLALSGKIPLHRMDTLSYGESAPIADNINRAGRMQNRRVTLVVLR